MASFVLFLFPLDVLDEIWDLIESVSEGFLTYSFESSHIIIMTDSSSLSITFSLVIPTINPHCPKMCTVLF